MNKLEMLGRLTKDVEVRYTQDQKMVVKFTIAINRRKNEHTDFFDVTAFGKTAEFISKYFNKGQQVAIVGRLQNNNYIDSEGKKHYGNIIIAEEVFFADSKKENNTEKQSEGIYENIDIETYNSDELPF
jgi:single-strand DNA-binding protein